ncbi:MAG: hypothetical protein IV084_06830 [Rugosibacter sp.]|nr:hypothetical protein [Rugosibacter sp.]
MPGFDPYDALIPVYLKTEAPQRVRQIGTAIFVELHGKPFLYTAAHVTDAMKHGELLIPTITGLSPIDGYVAYIDLPPEIRRTEDSTDIAYYRLSSEFARELCHQFQPLPQNRRELILNAQELTVCSASGYPASKSGKTNEGAYYSEIFSVRGVVADEETYSSLSLSPEQSIVIHFSKKEAIDPETGKSLPTPSLRGISGGGIFAWPEGESFPMTDRFQSLWGLCIPSRRKKA